MVSDDLVAPTRPRSPHATRLADLVEWLAGRTRDEGSDRAAGVRTLGDLDVSVTGLSLSSRRVRPGDLYAALPGSRTHGVDFADQAVRAGAVAVLTDTEGGSRLAPGPVTGAAMVPVVPTVVVDRPRAVLGRLAARVYGDPATALRTIAVTGTQGKTTTTRLAESGLRGAGVPAAVVGTVGTVVLGEEIPTALTTPEAPDLHGLFAVMRERGVVACALEVSSHALVQGRVDGVVFDLAVFTNLGRDHLDFHGGMEEYFQAKAGLFRPARARRALVCVDDEHGRRLAAQATVPVRTFSVHRQADWRAEDLRLTAAGSRFRVHGPGVRLEAEVPLPGEFNVANALAALAACAEAGFDPAAVAAGIARGGGVPGRFERVDRGQDFVVVVDYAHKPDAVAAALTTLRPLTERRLIVVLGAGGDRDPGKRPMMGEIAARLADVVVVTDDNPRTEDPADIRRQVLAGARTGPARVVEVGDRATAIREALGLAGPGDVVLVAGKGHETGQEVRGEVHPFDDRAVVARLLAERVGA